MTNLPRMESPMASTKNQAPKQHSGITKAGRSSKSGGLGRGKNSVAHQIKVLQVPKHQSPAERQQAIDANIEKASLNSITALRTKLGSQKNIQVLQIAELALTTLVGSRPSKAPNGATRSANATAYIATEQHFLEMGIPIAKIALGIRAARMEFDYQLTLV